MIAAPGTLRVANSFRAQTSKRKEYRVDPSQRVSSGPGTAFNRACPRPVMAQWLLHSGEEGEVVQSFERNEAVSARDFKMIFLLENVSNIAE